MRELDDVVVNGDDDDTSVASVGKWKERERE